MILNGMGEKGSSDKMGYGESATKHTGDQKWAGQDLRKRSKGSSAAGERHKRVKAKRGWTNTKEPSVRQRAIE